MVNNNLIQSVLMVILKGSPALVAKLAADTEIKEAQWYGTQYVYPAVRVSIAEQYPINDDENCEVSWVTFTVQSFSEKESSIESENISWEVYKSLHGKKFTQNGTGEFSNAVLRIAAIKGLSLVGAIRKDDSTWQADAKLKMMVEPS